jgi:hypothetical protein
LFLDKPYGILTDGGFILNRKSDVVPIISQTPKKKPKKSKKNLITKLIKSEKKKITIISLFINFFVVY